MKIFPLLLLLLPSRTYSRAAICVPPRFWKEREGFSSVEKKQKKEAGEGKNFHFNV
jgi:hypothetical protein